MLRGSLIAVGLLYVLAPETVIGTAERIALDNPDECVLRPWGVPTARAEGLLFLALVARGGPTSPGFKRFLGAIGIPALLYPKLYVDIAAGLAYTDAETCEWKSWCYPFTRLIGLVYVLVALDEFRKN